MSLAGKWEANESYQEAASFWCLHWLWSWTVPRPACGNERKLWGKKKLHRGASPLRQHRSIHSSMKKFRERNGIKDMDVRNTFFPIEPWSLGCRPVGWFGTETALWVPGLHWQGPDLTWGSFRLEANGENKDTVGAACCSLCPQPHVPTNLHWVSAAGAWCKLGRGGWGGQCC